MTSSTTPQSPLIPFTPLTALIDKLRAAGLTIRVHDDLVSVPSPTPDGFSVTLSQRHGEHIVHYDGWSQTFADERQALDCFAFGLTSQCRLKVFRRADTTPYRWTVEYLTDGQWIEGTTVGKLAFPLRQDRVVEYKQNSDVRVNA